MFYFIDTLKVILPMLYSYACRLFSVFNIIKDIDKSISIQVSQHICSIFILMFA